MAARALPAACVCLCLRLVSALSLSAQETLALGLDPASADRAWAASVNVGPPDWRYRVEGGTGILELRSARTSFGFQRRVEVELSRYPFLAWTWKALTLPTGGDCRSAKTDDQAVQVYVAFSPTRAIGYVWDSTAPPGTVCDSPILPPLMKVKMLVLRSGAKEAGTWLSERRNLAEDYARLFGEPMPALKSVGIRLWVNSQHTGSSAAGAYSRLAFEAREGASR
jgi:hypothetical protein